MSFEKSQNFTPQLNYTNAFLTRQNFKWLTIVAKQHYKISTYYWVKRSVSSHETLKYANYDFDRVQSSSQHCLLYHLLLKGCLKFITLQVSDTVNQVWSICVWKFLNHIGKATSKRKMDHARMTLNGQTYMGVKYICARVPNVDSCRSFGKWGLFGKGKGMHRIST